MSHTSSYPSKIIAIAMAASLLTACTEQNGAPGRGIMNGGSLNKTDVGTAAGVIGGGVLGSTIGGGAGRVAATIGGALLGGYLGNSIGSSLDSADRAQYDRASQQALESGRNQSWTNPHTGNHGSISPHKRYKNEDGDYCREYTQTIYVDGKKSAAHGTACREEDGSWQIVE